MRGHINERARVLAERIAALGATPPADREKFEEQALALCKDGIELADAALDCANAKIDELRAEVARLQAENDGLRARAAGTEQGGGRVSALLQRCADIGDRLERGVAAALSEQHAKLAAFARWAIHDGAVLTCPLEWWDVRDKAIELGLIVSTEEYDPAVHGEQDADPGDPWFVLAPWLEERT